MSFGILSLVPTVILFLMIFFTRRVFLALVCAGIAGAIIYCPNIQFLTVYTDAMKTALMGDFLPQIFLMMAMFGIYIKLVECSGSAMEFARWLKKFAKSRVATLLLTELMGIIIFVDDALNNVAVGTSMKRLNDSYLVPRSYLGYVTISTSAPVCILLPISTWAVINGGLMMENGVSFGTSAVSTFAAALPFMFFAFATLIILTLLNTGVIKWFGPAKQDLKLAEETGIVLSKEDSLSGEEVRAEAFTDQANDSPNPLKFLIPLLVLIFGTIAFDNNVVPGCVLGCVAAGVIMLVWDKIPLNELFKCCMDGIIYMAPLLIQLTLSTTMVTLNIMLGMPNFIVDTVTPYLSPMLMPVLVFVVLTLYSSWGGGFWEMSILFMPVIMPMALQLGVNPFLSAAAVVCASAAGSSMYICGDTIALVGSVMGVKPIKQAATIRPFALVAVICSAIAFLIAGIVLY